MLNNAPETEIQSVADKIVNITERMMTIGEEIIPITKQVESMTE